MKKLYHYHEPKIGSNCGDCRIITYRKSMPVFPKALRFKIHDYESAFQYLQGVNDFIQSTKIPDNCDKCSLGSMCSFVNYGDVCCRVTWRKIWEYVK